MGEENKEEKEEETKEKEMSVMDKLKKLRESIVVFPIIGKCIGELPVLFLSISAAIFAISILGFVLRLDIRVDLKSGYTPQDAPSVEEIGAHVKFFGNLVTD
ncbi:unnamed protein product [Enterobius vermicularis]|uniref:Reticulon-like protein n=1 Tax=Enterobius vermicularis TaxID=51028 RepID=A0A0N4VN85_ENTVE|nr:unnamed protein product [Enterobius vermicularis]